MSARPRRGATAAVLVTAAVALLAACGSGGGHHASAAPAPSAAGPDAAGPSATGTATTTDGGPAEADGSAAGGPKIPDSRLTPPGGGSFSPQQKQYLSGRVPQGDDPVAVLEGGQEVCERLARTSAIDPAAAASAIVTGDISRSGAAAAARSLCPDQEYVVAAAAHGFADGSHTVAARAVAGTSVAPGRYRAPNVSSGCTWRVAAADGRTLVSGSATTPARAVLTVPNDAHTVTSSGCYAWLPPITAPAASGTPTASAGTGRPAPASPTPSGRTS
ncbi:hypothetical protein RVR_2620 [Actinacidiphila reveromycinica]|uniref:Lipoprotein n=1 Tax=Actinacidiphila reveromycinica TaxID=659352 RepID=A0A7U3UQZ3_9ACTN|nr:hypothetical protein [Streptomyces sp. SN-593]BBA97053.1 hypothetical protein RVR_2620 [Streptomyces sp. SN-593]